MPKASKKSYYAVCVGREGPRIYNSWDEVRLRLSSGPITPELTHSSSKQLPPSGSTPIYDDDSDIEIIDAPPLGAEDAAPVEIILSPEQKQVLKKVERGESVFFTGSAGTGKSVLLREIIRHLRSSNKTIAITASTGIAAVNIGGSTIHSWAGIGLGEEPVKTYVGKFRGQKKLRNVWDRWKKVDALIIDEISMLDGVLFDKLECIGRELRGSTSPFGGIQVGNQANISTHFKFVNMLNEMRFGAMSESTVKAFKALNRAVNYEDGVQPTELFPHRADVDRANNARLSSLPGESHTYRAMDIPGKDIDGVPLSYAQMDRLLERLVVPKSITLKNLEQGSLVNGSVGAIVGFSTSRQALRNGISIARIESGQNAPFNSTYEPDQEEQEEEDANNPSSNARIWPVVRFTNGRVMLCIPLEFTVNSPLGIMEARRDQIPLILAWALSIHKSQGQTLERVKVDLGKIFEKGQGLSS
ncbi:PIF1-like helicase-domain-containing protein [Lentinula raphanica]|nr:PIF1-like helicase-domain-containing protein [Lentinula raphanica]